MKTKFYLVVSESGRIKTTKTKPHLTDDEVAMLINLEIPNQVFQRPALQATIKIREEQVGPVELTAETISQVQEIFLQSTGMELRIISPEQEGRNHE